ncbi:hypothetical protein DR64_7888 [Paraburkholderia xenovorans LB400]|nr:hypothetical protein DR64_7888 [Paraburkholderia xenovorans LB400]
MLVEIPIPAANVFIHDSLKTKTLAKTSDHFSGCRGRFRLRSGRIASGSLAFACRRFRLNLGNGDALTGFG